MALTATRLPKARLTELIEVSFITCQLVFGEVNGTVAARPQFLFEEVVVFNVALARLDEPRLVHLHNNLFDLLHLRLHHSFITLLRK
jgi:hypothetical protein